MESIQRVAIGIASSLCLFVAACAHGPSASAQRSDDFDPDDEDRVPPRACTAASTEPAPSDGRVATFAGGAAGSAEIVTYPPGGASAPTAKVSDGALHVTAHVPVVDKAQYVGVVLAFPKCMDASRFAGVSFTVRGSYKGCTMQYASVDEQHQDRHTPARYATGAEGTYPPQKQIEAAQVTSTAQTIRVPFDSADIRGRPQVPVDTSKLTSVLWQWTVSPAAIVEEGTTACDADLWISDVKLYE